MSAIIISLENDRHRIATELTEREIYAIGYVTVSWAHLEHLLIIKTMELAEKAKIPLPEDARALSFKKRRRVWRALIKKTVKWPRTRENLLNLATRIGSTERSRNRITHGLWGWDTADPRKLRVGSFRKPFKFEEPFDFEKLMKLGDRIGEINFQLTYPRGKNQAIKMLAQRGGGVSRRGMLILTGKDSEDPGLALPTPLTRNPPQSA